MLAVMRKLARDHRPTPEQAVIVNDPAPGYWLIRGAAGSGKTTTAVMRLRFLVRYWRERRRDLGLDEPVRVLVLTFNRTLRGYIDDLVSEHVTPGPDVVVETTTFGAWSRERTTSALLEHRPRAAKLASLAGQRFGWDQRFLVDEVDYVLGRWLPEDRLAYVDAARTGRGAPSLDGQIRRRLLDEVVTPYERWKRERSVQDWSDAAVQLAVRPTGERYDIVVVDETQDFSANQVRAITGHLAPDFVCTFIRDTTQRIYPNYFAWREVGIDFGAGGQRSRQLRVNYRNTKQIAAFARPLVEGLMVVEESNPPDFTQATREGALPTVLQGRFGLQAPWALEYLDSEVGADETVAFLHPRGGEWFSEIRGQLTRAGVPWVSIARESVWPEGDERVALSTMHSAKGLEFDHVLILGYNAEIVAHGDDEQDAMLEMHRRLLAMAVGRARTGVVIGYKPSDASRLIEFLQPGTFETVVL